MRIIAGLYKGRTLQTVGDLSVRPATGRVRETLFNMLIHRISFDGLRVIDAFAGSGSLGFEALSRGAAHVTFIEMDPDALAYIERNARTFACLDQVEILRCDAMQFFRDSSTPCGLIFADPPYAFGETAAIPEVVFGNGLLKTPGYLLIEHPSSLHFSSTDRYTVGPEKKFGRTLVTFFQDRKDAS